MGQIGFRGALRVRRGERDHELTLNKRAWARTTQLHEWSPHRDHLIREVTPDPDGLLAIPLQEAVFRFPAAPIHGVQRLHEGHNSAGGGVAQNFHTYRILTGPDFSGAVDRIFLFHNGLNEVDFMGLYYQLASHLLAQEGATRTACILRPFPGHFTRFPYYGFAETPLDRYLWDGSHLFRQFLRYMIETQWFLSALTVRSRFRLPAGASLLAEGEKDEPNRLDPRVLSDAIGAAWKSQYRASRAALRDAFAEQTKAPEMEPMLRGSSRIREDVEGLRRYLGLTARLGSEIDEGAEPAVHVIGYSLGGFVAQSVFMSWPYLVDSCSTLFSGGPLRELAPTAFADPEEWQTVLHSVRYEMDEAMMSGRLNPTADEIAGISRELFLYLQRTFYEVFEQEYRGSYQSRLTEFRQRMLFVVGGDDPIVKPKSVLDAEPPGGINMLEISGLGHFLGAPTHSPEEEKQRKYWLPEIGRVVSRFADESRDAHSEARRDTWLGPSLEVTHPPESERLRPAPEGLLIADIERGVFQQNGVLPTKLFDRYLNELLERAKHPGYLFVLRNEVPTFLLDDHSIQQRGCALHHDDEAIVEYCRGVEQRREELFASRPRISVVLPWNARRIIERLDVPLGFPSQAETAPGQMPTPDSTARTWAHCEVVFRQLTETAPKSVMVFDGRRLLTPMREDDDPRPRTAQHRVRSTIIQRGLDTMKGQQRPDGQLRVPSLPDCWIWASNNFLKSGQFVPLAADEAFSRFLDAVGQAHSEFGQLRESIRNEDVRVISVSRARYNPRFRGRLVTDESSAKSILLHAALCISAAQSAANYDWKKGEDSVGLVRFMRRRASDGETSGEPVLR